MKFYQGLIYLLSIIGIYLAVFLSEVLVVGAFVELFTTSYFIKFNLLAILLILVNPFITYYLGEKMNFKIHGLKVEEGIEADLHSEVEIDN